MLLYKHDSLPQFYHMRVHSSMAFQEKNIFILTKLCIYVVLSLFNALNVLCFASKRGCVCMADSHTAPLQLLHKGCGRLVFRFARIDTTETETDGDGVIYFLHKYIVDMSHFFTQTCFIDGADLFQ